MQNLPEFQEILAEFARSYAVLSKNLQTAKDALLKDNVPLTSNDIYNYLANVKSDNKIDYAQALVNVFEEVKNIALYLTHLKLHSKLNFLFTEEAFAKDELAKTVWPQLKALLFNIVLVQAASLPNESATNSNEAITWIPDKSKLDDFFFSLQSTGSKLVEKIDISGLTLGSQLLELILKFEIDNRQDVKDIEKLKRLKTKIEASSKSIVNHDQIKAEILKEKLEFIQKAYKTAIAQKINNSDKRWEKLEKNKFKIVTLTQVPLVKTRHDITVKFFENQPARDMVLIDSLQQQLKRNIELLFAGAKQYVADFHPIANAENRENLQQWLAQQRNKYLQMINDDANFNQSKKLNLESLQNHLASIQKTVEKNLIASLYIFTHTEAKHYINYSYQDTQRHLKLAINSYLLNHELLVLEINQDNMVTGILETQSGVVSFIGTCHPETASLQLNRIKQISVQPYDLQFQLDLNNVTHFHFPDSTYLELASNKTFVSSENNINIPATVSQINEELNKLKKLIHNIAEVRNGELSLKVDKQLAEVYRNNQWERYYQESLNKIDSLNQQLLNALKDEKILIRITNSSYADFFFPWLRHYVTSCYEINENLGVGKDRNRLEDNSGNSLETYLVAYGYPNWCDLIDVFEGDSSQIEDIIKREPLSTLRELLTKEIAANKTPKFIQNIDFIKAAKITRHGELLIHVLERKDAFNEKDEQGNSVLAKNIFTRLALFNQEFSIAEKESISKAFAFAGEKLDFLEKSVHAETVFIIKGFTNDQHINPVAIANQFKDFVQGLNQIKNMELVRVLLVIAYRSLFENYIDEKISALKILAETFIKENPAISLYLYEKAYELLTHELAASALKEQQALAANIINFIEKNYIPKNYKELLHLFAWLDKYNITINLNSSALYRLLEQFNNFYNAHPNQHEFFHIYLKKFLGSGGAALIILRLNQLKPEDKEYKFYHHILQLVEIPFELSSEISNKDKSEELQKLRTRWHNIRKRPQVDTNIAALANYYLGREKLGIQPNQQAAVMLYEMVISKKYNLANIDVLNDLIILYINSTLSDTQKAFVFAVRRTLLQPDAEAKAIIINNICQQYGHADEKTKKEESDLWEKFFSINSSDAKNACIIELADFYSEANSNYAAEIVTLLCEQVSKKSNLNDGLLKICAKTHLNGGYTIDADPIVALRYMQQLIINSKDKSVINILAKQLREIYLSNKNLPKPKILLDMLSALDKTNIEVQELTKYQAMLKSIWFPTLPNPSEVRQAEERIHYLSNDLIIWHKKMVDSKLKVDLSKFSSQQVQSAKEDLTAFLDEIDKIVLLLGHGLDAPTHIKPRRLSGEDNPVTTISRTTLNVARENFIEKLAEQLMFLEIFKHSTNREVLTKFYAKKINACYEALATLNDYLICYAHALGCEVAGKEKLADTNISNVHDNSSIQANEHVVIDFTKATEKTSLLEHYKKSDDIPSRLQPNPRKAKKAPASPRYLKNNEDKMYVLRSDKRKVFGLSALLNVVGGGIVIGIGYGAATGGTNTLRQWLNVNDIVDVFKFDGYQRQQAYRAAFTNTNQGISDAYNYGQFVNVLLFVILGTLVFGFIAGYATYQKLRIKPEHVGGIPQLFPLPDLPLEKNIEQSNEAININIATVQPSILKAAKPFTERLQQLANRARFIKDPPGLTMFEQVSSVDRAMHMPAKNTQNTFHLPITEQALMLEEDSKKIHLLNDQEIIEYKQADTKVSKLPANDYLLLSLETDTGQLLIIENTIRTPLHGVLLKQPSEAGHIAYEISDSINLKDLATQIDHDIEIFKSNRDLIDTDISKAKEHITKYLAVAPLISQNIAKQNLVVAAREFTEKLRELLNILNQINDSEQIAENRSTLTSKAKMLPLKLSKLIEAINQKIEKSKKIDRKKLKETGYQFGVTQTRHIENDYSDSDTPTSAPIREQSDKYNFFDSSQRVSLAFKKYVEPTQLEDWKELFNRISKSTAGLPFKVSDEWGSSYGIYYAFKKVFGDTVYIIDPDTLSTTGSIFDENINNAKEAANALLKNISGFKTKDGQRKFGILPEGILDKPLIIPLNKGFIQTKAAAEGNAIGGSHWTVMVVLPGNPINIFYINSCQPQEELPEYFKKALMDGSVNNFETQDKYVTDSQEFELLEEHEHTIPASFPNAQFIRNQNVTQQKDDGSDCAAWTVYNGIMIIFEKNTNFLEKFENTGREPAAVIRAVFPDLTKDQPMPEYSPHTIHAKK